MAGKGAIAPHHTDVKDGEWDADAVERTLGDDDVKAFRQEYAYVDPESPERKTGAKFPHHEVTDSGKVGAANVRALTSGVGILNGGRGGADIDKRERKAIYNHLATHLKDAGREPPPLDE
ncbi:MAG: hypothetical protein WD359_10755 [Dehalococcoidia bacterium]